MAATVSKAGPYYSTGSISFSSLRSNFKESSSGSIKASELRRVASTSNTNPVVPDCTENRTSGPLNTGISDGNNWKVSQFRNSIKYYYITQFGTDVNLVINGLNWNSNLDKNIKKWIYVTGTCGSNSTSSSAASFSASYAYNLTIDVSGSILGAGGVGGTLASPRGKNGGNALSIQNTFGSNLVVYVKSTANIYAGGGGGAKGATGANGTNGTCYATYTTQGCGEKPGCPEGYSETGTWDGNCCQSTSYCCGLFDCGCERCVKNLQGRYCAASYSINGGTGGEGGDGGPGRGYNNLSGSLNGAGGSPGLSPGSCDPGDYSVTPGNGLTGDPGGKGADWGSQGGNTNLETGGSSGRAIFGSNYSVNGIINSTTVKGYYT